MQQFGCKSSSIVVADVNVCGRFHLGHLPALHVGRNHALVLAGAGMGAFCVHLVGPSCVSYFVPYRLMQ